jgi:hypothetical protein
MRMGRERGILRWDVHAAILTQQRDRAERQLTAISTPAAKGDRERVARLTRDLEGLRDRLRALGPSPRARMG